MEQLPATEKVLFVVVVLVFILMSGLWTISVVTSLFMPCFHRILHATAFLSTKFEENFVFTLISWVVSCCCLTSRFGSALVVSRLQQRKAAWTLNITEEEMFSVFLEQVKCWSGWLIRLTPLMNVCRWIWRIYHFLVFGSKSVHKFKWLFTVDNNYCRS